MKVCTIVPKKYVDHLILGDDDEDSDGDDLFQRLFRCGRCTASFNTRRQVQRHTRREHLKMRTRRRVKVARSGLVRDDDYGRRDGENDGEETETIISSKESIVSSAANTVVDVGQKRKNLQWQNPRWKTHLSIVLKRLQFAEIEVSCPSKGVREIYYTSEAVATSSGNSSSDSGVCSSGSSGSSKFREWRLCSINALPRKIMPPEPPSVPKRRSEGKQSSPRRCNSSNSEKGLLLEIPDEVSFMFNVNGIKDDLHSILDVIQGQKMTTIILDAYLTRRIASYNNEINAGIRSAYKLRPISSTKFCLLSVRFLPVFAKNQPYETIRPNPKYLPKDPLDDDCVLIAPLYTCHHYYLAVFNVYTKSVYVYDSSWHYVPNELRLEQVKRVLISIFPRCNKLWKINFEFQCAQQIDRYSCGCYVIYFAENHLKSKSHRNVRNLTKAELVQLRVEIVQELLPTTKAGSQLLEAITE